MANVIRKALGLKESASLAETRAKFDEMLLDEMPAEFEKEKEKKEEDAANAQKKDACMSEVRSVLGLAKDADDAALLASVKGIVGDKQLTEKGVVELRTEVQILRDELKTLKPQAELAEKLEKERKTAERKAFFDVQLREGKLTPADRATWEELWEAGQEATIRKHFEAKKAGSAGMHLAETGTDGSPERVFDDPRDEVADLATKLAAEKKIPFTSAMNQVLSEKPELAQKIAALAGPQRVARR